jgi:2-haloacid dehalogenase
VTKPRPEIFDLAFDGLGRPDPDSALMVGDSLTSDIAGGNSYGIDTCWYNRHEAAQPEDAAITHEIRDLDDLESVVG